MKKNQALAAVETKKPKKAKAKRGKFIGSNPPYGYLSKEGNLVIREDETPDVIRRIFNEYLEGKGMDSIAKSLTRDKIKSPSQVAKKKNASPLWHASSIKNILNNRHYCGDLVQHKTETISVTTTKRRSLGTENAIVQENQHDSIISKDTFNAVQKMLKCRTRSNTAPKKHLFTNMLFCENCQKGMWYKSNQKGYRCGGNIKHGDAYCGNKKVIREKELEHLIIGDLKKLFINFQDDSFKDSIQKKLSMKKNSLETELLKLEDELKALRSKKMKYADLYTEEIISREELLEYREIIDQSLTEMKSSKEQLTSKLEECSNENYSFKLGETLKKFFSLEQLTPQVLHSLVNKVTCSVDGDLRIHYNFVNPFQEQNRQLPLGVSCLLLK